MRGSNGQALDTQEYRRAVLRLGRDRLDEMVASWLLDTILALPGYTTDARPADIAEVTSGVRYTAECLLDALDAERPFSEDEAVTLTIIGARRSHVPHDVLVTGTRDAFDASLDFLLHVAQEVPAPGPVAVAAVAWFRRALTTLREAATAALVAGHASELDRKPRTAEQEQMWLVDQLIHGMVDPSEDIGGRARTLGCILAAPFDLLLVVPSGDTGLDGLRTTATALAATVEGAVEGPVRPIPSAPHAVILLSKQSEAKRALQLEQVDEIARQAAVYVLRPDPAESVTTLPDTYRGAARSLDLPRRAKLPAGMVDADDLAYLRVITRAAPDEQLDFVERVIGPLLRTQRADKLVKTLEVLYRCRGGVPEAAATLGVHENTVYDRIRRTTELTGCELGVQVEAIRLFTSLRLRIAADSLLDGDSGSGPEG